MPDWDEESPILRKNLDQVTQEISRTAKRRETPTLQWARRWHAMMMRGLEVPAPEYVGAFRGSPGVENIGVEIGGRRGVISTEVVGELRRFESTLQALAANLDSVVPVGHELNADELAAVLDLCAWAHAEWVRIHPFVNGNGRTARIWANSLAKRYGLPGFVRLRPRPDEGYAQAGIKAMQGDWKPTAVLFRRMLDDFLDGF